MKTIYHIFLITEECAEVEGMFDENENLIGTWDRNDANWRGEYFDGFLKAVGISVVYARGDLYKRLEKKLIDAL